MRAAVTAGGSATVAAAVLLLAIPLGVSVTGQLLAAGERELEQEALAASFGVGATATPSDPIDVPAVGSADALAVYTRDGVRSTGTGPAQSGAVLNAARTARLVHATEGGAWVAAVPVIRGEAVVAVVRTARPRDVVVGAVAASWAVLLGLVAIVTGVGVLLARRTARRIAVPIEALADVARRIPESGLAEPSDLIEIETVRRALDEGSRRIAGLMERERRFAADASHQLRTPLAGLRANLELQLSGTRPDGLRTAIGEIDRLQQTIADMLAFAGKDGAVDPAEAVSRVVDDAAARWGLRVRAVQRNLSATTAQDVSFLRISATGSAIVLDVLLDNALRHGRGTIRITARRAHGFVAIDVRDDGSGSIPLPGSADHSAAGLGLPLARRTAERLGGHLVLRPGSSTCVTLLVPTA